jgi:uncharacterized protein YcgL (UPF0745 family)
MRLLGKPQFSMQLNLSKRSQLARVSLKDVQHDLLEKGYFLQMPPIPSNYLKDLITSNE